jgi:hypothetical protein
MNTDSICFYLPVILNKTNFKQWQSKNKHFFDSHQNVLGVFSVPLRDFDMIYSYILKMGFNEIIDVGVCADIQSGKMFGTEKIYIIALKGGVRYDCKKLSNPISEEELLTYLRNKLKIPFFSWGGSIQQIYRDTK